MSDYTYAMDLIGDVNQEAKKKAETSESCANIIKEKKLFDIQTFGQELKQTSQVKNQNYMEYAENISGYDLAANCIKSVVYKLLKTPVQSYADKWLPLAMRSTIGTAIHDFIQLNSNQFTEQEVVLKVPSIRFSGRLDCLINDNVLIEIKSVPYNDYKKILKKQTPRINDFYQAMSYKYVLENHTEEIKNLDPKLVRRGKKPLLDCYNIQYLQFVYVAHDLIAHDTEDLSEALKMIQTLKSTLNSKYNKFFFMTQLTIDLSKIDITQYTTYIETKIKHINYYLENNKIPPDNDPYMDPKGCFFCHYKNLCSK